MSRGRVLFDANVLIVATMDGHQHHEFWEDDISYADVQLTGGAELVPTS